MPSETSLTIPDLLGGIQQQLDRLENLVSENRQLLNDLVDAVTQSGIEIKIVRQAQISHGKELEELQMVLSDHLDDHRKRPKLTPLPAICSSSSSD